MHDADREWLLDRLPKHRRLALLTRYEAAGVDEQEVEQLIRQRIGDTHLQRGPRGRKPAENDVAILGSDGLFHLCGGSGWPHCDRRYRYPAHRVDWRHPDGSGRGRFSVEPDSAIQPWLVPPASRCVAGSVRWPGWETRSSQVGRLRISLAERFGRICQGCGIAYASCIDHDHVTGIVRGLLCGFCNTWIDMACLHVDRCPWAIYLNEPPAEHLGLQHPKAKRSTVTGAWLILPDRAE